MSGTDNTAETGVPPALEQKTAESQELTAVDTELEQTVAALTADDLEPAGRRQLLGRLAGDIRRRGLGQLFKPKAAMRWMGDVVADVAPHVPIRDLETLRRHYPGKSDDELADYLIKVSARATAGVGATGGGVASIQWVA